MERATEMDVRHTNNFYPVLDAQEVNDRHLLLLSVLLSFDFIALVLHLYSFSETLTPETSAIVLLLAHSVHLESRLGTQKEEGPFVYHYFGLLINHWPKGCHTSQACHST